MKVTPAFTPLLRPVHPAVALPGEKELQPLGKTRFPGPVPTRDDGKPGTGPEGEGGGRTDAAEAGDRDRLAVDPGAFPYRRTNGRRLRRCGLDSATLGPAWSVRYYPIERRRELPFTLEHSEHVVRPLVIARTGRRG